MFEIAIKHLTERNGMIKNQMKLYMGIMTIMTGIQYVKFYLVVFHCLFYGWG